MLRRDWSQEGPVDAGGGRDPRQVHQEERPWQLESPPKTRR